MTADRVAHYQQVAAGRPEGQPLPDALDQPVPTPASTYEALMQRLSSGVEMGGLPAGTDHQFANHQRVRRPPGLGYCWLCHVLGIQAV